MNKRPSRQFLEIAAKLSTVCAVTPQVIDWVSWMYSHQYRRSDLGIYVSLKEEASGISIRFGSVSAGTYAAAKLLIWRVIKLTRGNVKFFALGVPIRTVGGAWASYRQYTYVEGVDLIRLDAPADEIVF